MTNIPKNIHYFWFGCNEIPIHLQKCIETWQRIMPDYEITRWDESNFDFAQNKYAKEAYEKKRWAFVSDYARLAILKDRGGIYLDTDVELLQSLDKFLHHSAFAGFESDYSLGTAIIGAEPDNPWISKLLAEYDERVFLKGPFKKMDLSPNSRQFTSISKNGSRLTLDNSFQELERVTIYPSDYFYPKDPATRVIWKTENTTAIHHSTGSSTGLKYRLKHSAFDLAKKLLPPNITEKTLTLYGNIRQYYANKK